MGYNDALVRFDNAAAHLTTEASDDIIDWSSVGRDIGTGETLYIVAVVTTAFTDAGSDSTMTLVLETDALEAFGSATTAQTIGTFAALSAVGSRLAVKLDPGVLASTEQFMRIGYTVAGGDLTTGAFTTYITHNIESWKAYPDGYTITT